MELKKEKKKNLLNPRVMSLSGVIDLPTEFNYKKGYRDYLSEKYK